MNASWGVLGRTALSSLLLMHGADLGRPARLPAQESSVSIRVDTVPVDVGPPVHRGIAHLVPQMTIGTVNGPDAYTLAGLRALAVRTDGGVYVLESPLSGSPRIRLYDATGRHVRNIGRTGKGPGEYTRLFGIAVLPDDRLVALDVGRLNVYTGDGDPIDTWLLPGYNVSVGGTNVLTAGPGGVMHIMINLGGLRRDPARAQTRESGVAVVRIGSHGEVIDTVPEPDLPQLLPSRFAVRREAMEVHYDAPYAPRALWAWSPLGYYITGVTNRYAIDYSPIPSMTSGCISAESGRQAAPAAAQQRAVCSIRREVVRVAVGAEELADGRARLARLAARGEVIGQIPEVPQVKPVFKSLLVGADGRIWVELSQTSQRVERESRGNAGGWIELRVFDVLEPDGTYIGQVSVPQGVELHYLRGTDVWGVVQHELGVPFVRKYRIAWQ
jgi:hypothetical protein